VFDAQTSLDIVILRLFVEFSAIYERLASRLKVTHLLTFPRLRFVGKFVLNVALLDTRLELIRKANLQRPKAAIVTLLFRIM
jgi:hypothetical protein